MQVFNLYLCPFDSDEPMNVNDFIFLNVSLKIFVSLKLMTLPVQGEVPRRGGGVVVSSRKIMLEGMKNNPSVS